MGHQLFKTTPETFTVPFIAGDAFNPSHLKTVPPFSQENPPPTPRPNLKMLTSLNPLLGHVSAIHASSFFHLFPEADQLRLARALAGLLSPEPGSVIFGQHSSQPTKGLREAGPDPNSSERMFCHNPQSWTELWDGEVFGKGAVRVQTELKEVRRPGPSSELGGLRYALDWSVTRL
jgi:hypothetical protein